MQQFQRRFLNESKAYFWVLFISFSIAATFGISGFHSFPHVQSSSFTSHPSQGPYIASLSLFSQDPNPIFIYFSNFPFWLVLWGKTYYCMKVVFGLFIRCEKCLFSSFNDVRESCVTGFDDSYAVHRWHISLHVKFFCFVFQSAFMVLF